MACGVNLREATKEIRPDWDLNTPGLREPGTPATTRATYRERDGFDIISTKGSPCKLRRGPRTVIVPMHDEVRPGTLASILRAAGMSPDRPRELR